jgi:LuxR family transcriptional regulator, maltose regulon positive regulatory protein
MPIPMLFTKLFIPPSRSDIVLRLRLIDRLNEGLHRKLTLISAPAGFGKTTLVSQWVAGCQRPIAWLSLDEGDDDLTRFLIYLIAALQTIEPKIGAGSLVVLQASPPLPVQSVLTALLNDISTFPDPFILVLDDYHVLDSPAVDEVLAFLLDHLPSQMHLVIGTREDPHLPLPRLRARGQLTELRAADLRFTPLEAAEFLNRVMGLALSAENIGALETRTEGWIAGLQLAALSMQGRSDADRFIQAFTGSHRFVLDYLVEEVLCRQPEYIHSFLLKTAILDRLCGSLCDAVTGREDGKGMLETLERGNLFIIPLDDQRQWYRYHALFTEVLRSRLLDEQKDQISSLHQRASEWHERNGSAADAIHHALAARDFERAASLVEQAIPEMRKNRQAATVVELGWLKALPEEIIRVRPVLSVDFAYALFGSGELETVEARLQEAERWLEAAPGDRQRSETPLAGMVVVNEMEFRRLPGMIALLRTAQALARGDMPETVKNARRVLDLAPEDDHLMLGGAASTLGLAAWASGDLDAARQMIADGMANVRKAGYISPAIGDAITLADIQIAQGRLHEAMTTYEQALQWAMAPDAPVLRGAADMYVGMSDLYREQNDLKTAAQYLLTSQELGELAGLPQNPYRWCAAMARIREAQGDLAGALDLLDHAERLYDGNFSPNVRPIAARKARLWAAQGRLSEALGWVREQGLLAENELSYLHEFEAITFARILLACYRDGRAEGSITMVSDLLERLLKAAGDGGRKSSVIELLVLQAMVYQVQGRFPAALMALQQALALAEPEGYVRIFLDEGPGMLQLLREAAERDIMPGYTDRLLAAFAAEQQGLADKSSHPETGAAALASPSLGQPPIEALTQRELEILRLFKTELSGPEIAHELVISLSTVRTHTKRIYSKLDVNTRRAAVKRAEDLDLI